MIDYNDYLFIDCAKLILNYVKSQKSNIYLKDIHEIIKKSNIFRYVNRNNDEKSQRYELNQIIRASLTKLEIFDSKYQILDNYIIIIDQNNEYIINFQEKEGDT